MALPQYLEAQGIRLRPDTHRGLWWSRFFDKFSADFCKPGDGEKGAFITGICRERCGDAARLTASAKRIAGLARALGGESHTFISQGRFATGMGNDHPTENGFTWHPTLGVPYLPASSVKGLVRGWIEWNGNHHEHERDLKNWFGSQTKMEASEQAGWFIFFDALPTETVQLAADVMTPHYGKWYEQGSKNPLAADSVPADWHSPVPVTFLTVKKITLQFALAVRCGLPETQLELAQNALPKVLAVLRDALEWAGAGAKAATGYGRFMADPAEEERRQIELEAQSALARLEAERRAQEAAATAAAARLAAMSPIDRKLEAELAKPSYKGLLQWQAWLNTLSATGLWEEAEKRELAQRIKAAMQADGVWLPEEKSKKGERCRKIQALLGE